MIIICDNSPLSALAEIGLLDVLQKLYGTVTIPEAVHREACDPHAPDQLREFFARRPEWMQVVPVPLLLPETLSLGAGESAAISLAWRHQPDAVIVVDERPARRLCDALAIRHTGTAGVLAAAAKAGLLDFEQAVSQLRVTSFRLKDETVHALRMRLKNESG